MSGALITQVVLEVLVGEGLSAEASGTFLQHIVSGVSVINVIGLAPLVVSSDWITPPGGATFSWIGSNTAFPATTSGVGYTVSGTVSGSFERIVFEGTYSNATTSFTSTFIVHTRHQQVPTPYDGPYQGESQYRRRIFP
jgi:hypothetical protein